MCFLAALGRGRGRRDPRPLPGSPPRAAMLDGAVVGHREEGGRTLYRVEVRRGCMTCTCERRLCELRALHDRVICVTGEARYREMLRSDDGRAARFPYRGGLPGTTARLDRWMRGLLSCVDDPDSALCSVVLRGLDADVLYPALVHAAPGDDGGGGAREWEALPAPAREVVAELMAAMDATPPHLRGAAEAASAVALAVRRGGSDDVRSNLPLYFVVRRALQEWSVPAAEVYAAVAAADDAAAPPVATGAGGAPRRQQDSHRISHFPPYLDRAATSSPLPVPHTQGIQAGAA